MAFSPVSWAYKDLISSAKLAQMIENVRVHDHYTTDQGAQIRRAVHCRIDNTATTVPATQIIFNRLKEQYYEGATPMWTAGDPSKIFIRTTGLYLVRQGLPFADLNGNTLQGWFRWAIGVNSIVFGTGSDELNGGTLTYGPGYWGGGSGIVVRPLTAGDYITSLIQSNAAYPIRESAAFSATLLGRTP